MEIDLFDPKNKGNLTLRILYQCGVCGHLYEDNFYDLNVMYGTPSVCAECEG